MTAIVHWTEAITAFLAAALWFASAWDRALLVIPFLATPVYGRDLADIVWKLGAQSRLNASAAVCAGISAALQGIELAFGPFR